MARAPLAHSETICCLSLCLVEVAHIPLALAVIETEIGHALRILKQKIVLVAAQLTLVLVCFRIVPFLLKLKHFTGPSLPLLALVRVVLIFSYSISAADLASLRQRQTVFLPPRGLRNLLKIFEHLHLLLLIDEDLVLELVIAALLLPVWRLCEDCCPFYFALEHFTDCARSLRIIFGAILLVDGKNLLAEADAALYWLCIDAGHAFVKSDAVLGILSTIIELKTSAILANPKHVRRNDVTKIRQDVDCLIELLLKQVIGLGSDDPNLYPLRSAHMRATVALNQCLLSDGLELGEERLGLLVQPVSFLLLALTPLLLRFIEQADGPRLFSNIDAARVLPEFQIVRYDLWMLLEQVAEALESFLLVLQGMRIDVRLEQQAAWAVDLLLEVAQNRQKLRGLLLLLLRQRCKCRRSTCSCAITILFNEATIDQVDDDSHVGVYLQESLD